MRTFAELSESDVAQVCELKSALARKTFVTALAERASMHDLYEPVNGPHSAAQSCAVIEHECLERTDAHRFSAHIPGVVLLQVR